MLEPVLAENIISTTEAVSATLVVDQLSHRYADGHQALKDVSFTLLPGEKVGIIGANGAGKTTLFLRIAGVLPGTAQRIKVAGLDPAVARQEIPKHVGIVFQNPDDQLFCPTVLEDIAFGPLNLGLPAEEAERLAEEALRRVGLQKIAQRSPQKLSGGEKRRVAFAGVWVMNPSVWLLDEPTMFLDPRSRRELIELIQTLPGTLLLASHDLSLIRELCPRTLLFDQGELIADDATSEIIYDEELLNSHFMEALPRRI